MNVAANQFTQVFFSALSEHSETILETHDGTVERIGMTLQNVVTVSIESITGFETDLRMLTCENWIALYRVEDKSGMISVARIIDARLDYMRILFGKMNFAPAIEKEDAEER